MGESEYKELIASDPSAAAKLFVAKDTELREQAREIEKLRNHIVNATKAKFGAKSERLPSGKQEELFAVDELTEEPEQESLPTIDVPAHKRSAKRKRRGIPVGTPVITINHPPAVTTCECCGKNLVEIRHEITKLLNYVPARIELHEHHRPVMACPHCKGHAPVTTPLPAGTQLIPRSPAGTGLLSHILISKYQDHIPLNRLESMFARFGFELPRKRMCEWLGFIAELLLPLHRAIKRELLLLKYLQADETTTKIQDGEEPGKCHTGYFWGLLGPPPVNLVYFHYADSRAGEVPKAILSGFKGVLQTDMYAGYNPVYVPEHAVRAGCWAHVRRKLLGIVKLAERDVQKALKLIAELYHLERADRSLDDTRATREKQSKLVCERLYDHLSSWSARTLPQSEVQKALQYALVQWQALTLFLNEPYVALDNNLIENQMRPIALGRKNWMFAGSHEGAMRAAIFFSLINSCRLNKINTWQYFNDVLPKLAAGSIKDLSSLLLPHRWAVLPSRPDAGNRLYRQAAN